MYKYRHIQERVRDSLAAFRIVSLTGARQVGKTTLARQLCAEVGRRYTSFEDPVSRAAAAADPDAWLAANPPPLAIDEVQYVPAVFPALKRRVDEDPRPGQYLITGSALWLSMKTIGESLAGRTAILEMFPFRPCEWRGAQWDWALCFGKDDALLRSPVPPRDEANTLLWNAVMTGGYPEPAAFASARARRTWHESYLRTYLQRDVQDLAQVGRMVEFTRLIRLLASQTGALVNQSALARDLGLPQSTVRRYLEWLRVTYQCHALPPYSANLGKRLVKTPKYYWSDSGAAAALAGLTDRESVAGAQKSGALIETWVVNDLHAWRSETGDVSLSFWRTHGGGEVDVLIERQGEVVAVEIKAGHRIDARDLRGLRECRAALGKRFRRGIVLHGGGETQGLEKGIVAIPLTCLLGRTNS